MKKIKTLEIIENLINKEVKFISSKKDDIIYIDYGILPRDLKDAYKLSKKIAKLFDTNVIFHFNGSDILVDKKTKEEKVLTQYFVQQNIHTKLYVESKFNKAVTNLNLKNAKNKTKEVFKLMEDKNVVKQYISKYQINNLSHTLTTVYKSNQPDPYLDSMVEEAKVLKKVNK